MTMATRVRDCLENAGVSYEIVMHPYAAASSMETAEAARVSGERLAKAVVLKDGHGFLLAVLPATRHLDMEQLSVFLERDLGLATEDEIRGLFEDCDPGAIPPLGAAYGLPVVLDESLLEETDIYLEGGGHRDLIRMTSETFARLMEDARRGRFSMHM